MIIHVNCYVDLRKFKIFSNGQALSQLLSIIGGMKERVKRGPGRPKGSKNVTIDEIKGFGQRLKALREKRGLTQQELSQATKTDWTQISRYERDVNLPTADRVVAIARALHVTPNNLLLGTRGEEKIEFNNLRLYERFRALDRLPREEHEAILRIVDAVLAKYEYENVTERTRRAS